MDSNPYNDDNNEENNENLNTNKNEEEEDKQSNIIDELINEIKNSKINGSNNNDNENNEEMNNNNLEEKFPNEVNNNFDTVIINDNVNQKLEDEIYNKNDKNDENDFSNPFENMYNDKPNEQNNFNPYKNGNNEKNNKNINNNYEEDKPDNDFINPFKDFNFNEQKPNMDNNLNPYEEKNNNQISNPYNNINNTNNKVIDINESNDFSNPFLERNNNNNNNNNDDNFSNPFKNAFDNNENNKNCIDNTNNNNFVLRQNQNNNQNNYNIYSIPNKGSNNNYNNNQYNNSFSNNNNFYNNYNNNNFNNNYNNRFNNNNNFNNNPCNNFNNNNFTNNNFTNNNFNNNKNLNNNYYRNNNNFNNNNDYYNPNKLNRNINNNNNFNKNIENNQNNQNNQNKKETNINPDIPYIKKIEIKNENSANDYKKIEAIIKKCESLYNTAKTNYVNDYVKESIATLKKIISTLDSVHHTITTQKSELSFFLPKIKMLDNLASTTLNDFLLNFYELIDLKYKSINPPPTNSQEVLFEVCSKFILKNPFISFEDIYDKNNMENNLNEIMREANFKQTKCILLYGGKGVGKTLLVHGYAKKIGASVAQLEGTDFLKVPFFAKEFVKVCVKNVAYNKPLFVYIRNIEKMFPCMNQLNFIYDKVASSFKLNIYFIASTTVDLRSLYKNIYDKFQFYLEVKNVEPRNKPEFLRFICDKIGIKLNINLVEYNDFVQNYLGSFTNKKIFEFVKLAINLKKEKTMQNEDPNWIYKEGLNLNDFKNAISNISPYL